jgi:hypothetical protein
MAWNSVDLPTLARPTWRTLVSDSCRGSCAQHVHVQFVHTIPAFRLLPGRPSWTGSSLTTFLGGMFLFFLSLLLA